MNDVTKKMAIWDGNPFVKIFLKDVGIVYTPGKTILNVNFITEVKSAGLLIILCELQENENEEPIKRQDLYGIELAKKLRRENINVPIIFTSFLSRKQVYANKLERGIINTIGHNFIQLPCTPQQLEAEASKMQPLNELEMYDIIHNYCSLGGIIKMLLHSLNGLQSALNNLSNTPKLIKDKIRNAIVQAHSVFNKIADAVLVEFDSKFKELTAINLNEAIRFAENIGTELVELYATDGEISSKPKAKRNWKLLLLEDEITEDHPLVNKLKERDVQVICASDAQEAKSIVEKETLLSLIVSDYRLENEINGLKIHQPIQGYQFLKQISDERPGYLCLAALSSLPRKFLMESFKHYGLRVEIYSKKDYLENEATINLLCDEFVDLGNENAEAITRTPRITSDNWMFFEPFYLHHRNSINYAANENYVSQKAKEYSEGIKQNKFPFHLTGYTSLNLEGGKAKPSNEKIFQIYLQKCICRRVAIWYTQYNKGWQLKDVHKIIKGNDYSGEEKETTAKNQINSNLALSLNEYPWNMTIEEKHWLMYQMNIPDIEKIEQQELAVLKIISEHLEKWLSENELLEDIINKKQFEPFFTNSKERYSVNFKMLKSFLHQLYLFFVGKDDLIQDLQLQIIAWQKKTLNLHGSENISRFTSYLEDFRRRLMFTKSFKKDAKIKIGTYDEFYINIMTEAIKRVAKNEHQYFPGTAFVFYNSVAANGANFNSKSAWIEALLEFHAKEMKQWYGDDIGFDEVKAFRKNKTSSSEDFDS